MGKMAGRSEKHHDYCELNDEDLMQLYRGDVEAAFDVIYRRYAAKVYGFLRKKLQNQDAAVDVCQIVFIKLHKSRALYDGSVPFAPWLFTIARNALIDWQRTQNLYRHHHALGVDVTNLASNDETRDEGVEMPVLESLSQDQREAVEMRYLESLDFEDIARRLGTSSSNARQLVSRGLKKIRTLFQAKEKMP